jgi:MYXO-CTERM domain-containing protein
LLLQAGLADFEQIDPEVSWNRWGDYSATVVDPSDPLRFWTFQEYVEAEDIYGIRITELILSPEPGMGLLSMSALLCLAALRRRRE